MTSWYIIDAHGTRQIAHAPSHTFEEWPAFALISANAPLETFQPLLLDLLAQLDLLPCCADHTDAHPLYLHQQQHSWTLAAELSHDPDSWTLSPELAASLAQALSTPLAYLSHDADTGAILLDLHDESSLWLRWQDALDPSLPAEATLFSSHGTCTLEDARAFALRMLDLPAHTPTLDRHAFIEFMLRSIGLQDPIIALKLAQLQDEGPSLIVKDLLQ